MKVYGQLERAQAEMLSADPTGGGIIEGRMWYNTTGNVLKYRNDSADLEVVDTSTAQTLTNKTLTSPAINGANFNFGTASNTNRLLLPDDTTANLDLLTDTEKLLAYDTTRKRPVYNDGTQWKLVGSGAGDADTIHLIRANDDGITNFTLKSDGNLLPDFTATDSISNLSVPTSGNVALLSNDNAHKTFKLTTSTGTQYDAYGISLNIPKGHRGKNLGFQHLYRTEDETVGTASVDAAFMPWMLDDTNAIRLTVNGNEAIGQTTLSVNQNPTALSTDTFVDGDVTVGTDVVAATAHGFKTGWLVQLTTTGTLPAGLALTTDYYIIAVDDNTLAFATSYANAVANTRVDITAASGGGTHTISRRLPVGTKIWISCDSDVLETHVTAITSTTIDVADALVSQWSSGKHAFTGVLTDILTTYNAADSDIAKKGSVFTKYPLIPETCESVTIMFQQLTSETDNNLYFDNILLTADPFKKVETQEQSEEVHAEGHAGFGSTNANIPYFTTLNKNDVSKYGTVENSSANGFSFTASRRCRVSMTYSAAGTAAFGMGITLNSDQLSTGIASIDQTDKICETSTAGAGSFDTCVADIVMNSGDVLRPHSDVFTAAGGTRHILSLTVTPEKGTSIIVESQQPDARIVTQLEGNDGRVITVNTESVPFNGTADFWTSGADGSSLTNGNYYTVQNDNATIHVQVGIAFTAQITGSIGMAVNGSGYRVLSAYPPNTYYKNGSYTFSAGEVSQGDKISFYMASSSGTLINDTTRHYLTIVEIPEQQYKPLLALPTVTHGNEPEFYYIDSQVNFFDAATATYEWDHSLSNKPFSDSNYIEVADISSVTRVTAKKRCEVHWTVEAEQDAAAELLMYIFTDGGAKVIDHAQVDGANENCSVTAHVVLDEGEYLYVYNTNPYSNRLGCMHMLVKPIYGVRNDAAIINPYLHRYQKVLAADYQISSSFTTWQVPDSTFSVTVPAGRYILNLEGVSEAGTSSSAVANQISLEYAFATSTTAGVGHIGQKMFMHHHCYSVNNWNMTSFNHTCEKIFTCTSETTIYVQMRQRGFSGSPTMSFARLRAESGAGNGMDPVLTATRIE